LSHPAINIHAIFPGNKTGVGSWPYQMARILAVTLSVISISLGAKKGKQVSMGRRKNENLVASMAINRFSQS
jgi:hypothetical protein